VTGEAGLSSLLVFPRRGNAKLVVLSNLRKRGDLQVADVPTEIRRLLDLIGNVDRLFLAVSLAVGAVALLSVMVALFNAMNERRREIAILRALGMPRHRIVSIVVVEAAMIGLLGGSLGLILAHLGLSLASDHLEASTGMQIRAGAVEPVEGLLLIAAVVAAALAGMIPAWRAYRTDVARHLAPTN
jgi:putative ABC transport system permease protein